MLTTKILVLRQERKKRGWSLVKVSMLTGISPNDVSSIERGLRYVYPGWRKRLAAAFKMPEEELFKEVET